MGLYLQVILYLLFTSHGTIASMVPNTNSEPVDYKLKMFGIETTFGIQSSDFEPRLYLCTLKMSNLSPFSKQTIQLSDQVILFEYWTSLCSDPQK